MKKLITVVVVLSMVTTIIAQDETQSDNSSGDSHGMWLGGKVGFGNMADGGADITLGPSFGLMLGDRFGAGITGVISSGNNSSSWSLEPYVRLYFPVLENFSFYGDAFLAIGGPTATDETYLGLGARIGAQFWFTPRWSMAASSNVLTWYSDSNSGHDGLGLGLNMNALSFSMFWHF